jgi:hypothetical protein
MGTGILFLLVPLSIAIFGQLLRTALEFKTAKRYREMWGTLFWALVPFGLSCLVWAALGDSTMIARNATLGVVGAIIGASAFIWSGYVIRDATNGTRPPPMTEEPIVVSEERRPTLEATRNSKIDATSAVIPGDLHISIRAGRQQFSDLHARDYCY